MKKRVLRAVYDLRGIVQGVGFRPAVYRLACRWGLTGSVVNRSGTVRLVLEGSDAAIDGCLAALRTDLPENARIDGLHTLERVAIAACERAPGFVIGDSHDDERVEVVIPPDLKICSACLREIMDPRDRRYGYPFTTCTRCGPRYTVVERMPYDRVRTTMADFELCAACRREYTDPNDRRFHAETIACPRCGPALRLETAGGDVVEPALPSVRKALHQGDIVAVRGIGGFHLAADAGNRDTVQRLRAAKHRPHKPFAVMAPDLATLRAYCRIPAEAERLLASPAAPIVILDVKPEAVACGRLPLDLISPDTMTLGALLPTSPLHHLLFEPLDDDPLPRFDLLVMTSGNRGGEPICIRNDEARERLAGIADTWLLHNRRIRLRNDDSVCVLREGKPQLWRRARGYAPSAIRLHRPLKRCVLALGAELKNAIALGDGSRVVLSPHIGDLETPEALGGLERVVATLPAFLERRPECVAVDLHPDMHATRIGEDLAQRLCVPLLRVQHHHAHGAACMAEHGIEHALALCFDGTGLGTDGAVWGAELLEIRLPTPERRHAYRRWATFAPVRLPGADAAVRQPVRQLIARWRHAGAHVADELLPPLGVTRVEVDVWTRQCTQDLHAPLTHAAGRLFDAYAALLGLAPAAVTYEGQAAIRLEAAARQCPAGPIPCVPFAVNEHAERLIVDWNPAFACAADLPKVRANPGPWALAFHHAVARAAMTMLEYGLAVSEADSVVLSGGVFMNRLLSDLLVAACRDRGLRVLLHRQSPPNDGCTALGQAVIAGN